jgi:hypothetical protein
MWGIQLISRSPALYRFGGAFERVVFALLDLQPKKISGLFMRGCFDRAGLEWFLCADCASTN